MLCNYRSGKIAIAGWHEGIAGQLHAMLKVEGIPVACFVNDTGVPIRIDDPPPRVAQKFSYPSRDGLSFKGLPLVTTRDWVAEVRGMGIDNILIAGSDNKRREKMLSDARGRINIIGYIHPTAVILPEAIVEEGVIILANAVLGYRAEAQAGVFISTSAQVDHHSVMRPCCALFPGVIICGNVEVGSRTTVGAGATIINSIRVGEDCFVGAGALVRKDVAAGMRVVGVPARPIETEKQ